MGGDPFYWMMFIAVVCYLGMLLTPLTSLRQYLIERKLRKLRGE